MIERPASPSSRPSKGRPAGTGRGEAPRRSSHSRTFGAIEVTGFAAGEIRVQGRAMFGAVPRKIWSEGNPPDAEGRVALALNCFLVRTPGALILADTGIGTLLDGRYLKYYRFSGDPGLEAPLAALGFRPGDIDVVFNSHLHFDHCGGNVTRDPSGAAVPAFPRARYVVRGGEWRTAFHPPARDKTSYFPDRLKTLEAFDCLDLIEEDHEIAEGVEAVLLPGHTAFHQGLKVTGGGATFLFAGDIIPTAAHAGLGAVMSYDLFPEETRDTRKKILERAAAGAWVLGYAHDPGRFFGGVGAPGTG